MAELRIDNEELMEKAGKNQAAYQGIRDAFFMAFHYQHDNLFVLFFVSPENPARPGINCYKKSRRINQNI